MEDIVLLPRVAHLVGEGDFHVLVGRIDLAATFIDGTEDRFDARSGLRHERCRSRGCDGEHGDVAAAYLRHLLVQGRVGFADAFYHRIALLLEVVVHREGAPFAGHLYRGPVGFHGQRLLYLHREGYRFVGAVSEPQCGEHVALGGDAESRAAALECLLAYLLPQGELYAADVEVFRVVFYLVVDDVYLFEFEVDDVVHQSHGRLHMAAELVEVELRLRGEGVVHIAVQVYRQQAAAVVGTERNLAAGVGGYRAEAFVGIAVGYRLTDDGIPEEHAGFGALPGVVDDFVPQRAGIYLLDVHRVVRIYREFLHVLLVVEDGTHEFVVYLDGDVGARYLARLHFGVDEIFRIRVLDGEREHQGAAPAVLRHFAGGVGVAFHEGNDTGRGERAVEYGASGRPDMREVVSDSAPALHELYLFLVDAYDAAVGVGGIPVTDNEAVGERRYLEVVSDARHGTSLRDDVAELLQQVVYLLRLHRIGVGVLDAGKLVGDAPVHLFGRFLEDVAERVFQRVFADPHHGGQVVALEVLLGALYRLVVLVFGKGAPVSTHVFLNVGHKSKYMILVLR